MLTARQVIRQMGPQMFSLKGTRELLRMHILCSVF